MSRSVRSSSAPNSSTARRSRRRDPIQAIPCLIGLASAVGQESEFSPALRAPGVSIVELLMVAPSDPDRRALGELSRTHLGFTTA
jgi:hypothetical protein